MNRYLIVRRWRSVAEATDYVGRMEAADQPQDVRWDHTHVSEDAAGQLTSFCVYDAPSAEVLRAHIDSLGGFELVGIYPVVDDVRPDGEMAYPGG